LVFTASFLAFTPFEADLQGSHLPGPLEKIKSDLHAPLVTSHLLQRLSPLSPRPIAPSLLSWVSFSPLPTSPDSSSPAHCLQCASEIGLPPSLMGHPRGFSPPRWFAPSQAGWPVASNCQLWGSPCFQRQLLVSATPCEVPSSRETDAFPNSAAHTLRSLPLVDSVAPGHPGSFSLSWLLPASTPPALRPTSSKPLAPPQGLTPADISPRQPLPSHPKTEASKPQGRTADLSCLSTNPLLNACIAADSSPILPWALLPLQGLPASSTSSHGFEQVRRQSTPPTRPEVTTPLGATHFSGSCPAIQAFSVTSPRTTRRSLRNRSQSHPKRAPDTRRPRSLSPHNLYLPLTHASLRILSTRGIQLMSLNRVASPNAHLLSSPRPPVGGLRG